MTRASRSNASLLTILLVVVWTTTTNAIRPSLLPQSGRAARRVLRPAFHRFFRTVADEHEQQYHHHSKTNTNSKTNSPLDQLQYVDNTNMNSTITREALAQELSSLMAGIETLAEQVEATRSIPPETEIIKSSPTTTTKSNSSPRTTIRTVQELRHAIFEEGYELKDLQLDTTHWRVNASSNTTTNDTSTEQQPLLLNHQVVQLIAHRFRTGSTPGNRAPDDTAHLALAIEGGGMRGAVSAGMASAIACLGLCDCFDSIYGSSAGSVIGAYMVSRQMCMDVYVDILPAAKRSFVCTKRIMSSLAITAVDLFLQGVSRRRRQRQKQKQDKDYDDDNDDDEEEVSLNLPSTLSSANSKFAARTTRTPGMNISFVLDGIMDPHHGIRPIDMETFQRNNRKQPLNVASSYAKNGRLYTKCFSTQHFFGPNATTTVPNGNNDNNDNNNGKQHSQRKGLFACLEPSMTVPGATGPPVRLYNTQDSNDNDDNNKAIPFFDAFCFEPLPYRSAVEQGATHVMVLCSRPEGFEPKTKPGVYETAIAPLYFKSHGEPQVADFFARGGQQYIYLEDILTLEQGKTSSGDKPIPVPPAQVMYGVEEDHPVPSANEETWNKAHLLPLQVPRGTPELATLEQGKEAVREAVQGGFAAAFDLLAPAIGLNTHGDVTGMEVAKLVFPEQAGLLDEVILNEQKRILGDAIVHTEEEEEESLEESSSSSSPSGLRREKRRKRDVFIRNARRVLRRVRNRKQRQEEQDGEEQQQEQPQQPQRPLSREEQELEQKAKAFEDSVVGGPPQPQPQPQQQQQRFLDPIAFTAGNDQRNAEQLLNGLPGIQSGRLAQLAVGLRVVASNNHDRRHNREGNKKDESDDEDGMRQQILKA